MASFRSNPFRLQLTELEESPICQGHAPQAVASLWKGKTLVACGSLWWDGPHPQPLSPLGEGGQKNPQSPSPDMGEGSRVRAKIQALPRVGRLGKLDSTAPEAAVAFLDQVCEVLRQKGCDVALGPMDGNTWQSYRCALNWENGPPFWGEPQTDPRWADWFTHAGFAPVAKYESRLCLDLTQTYLPRRRRQTPASVQIQSAQGVAVEALLPKIHALVMASFRRQPFFQSLPEDGFTQYLQPLISQVDPALIQLAWDQDRLVGVGLALPDRLTMDVRRLIIKTLAIGPNRAYAGLGAPLLEAAHHAGFQQGYRQAIHALMHDQNPSLNLSHRYSQPFRDYVLMGKNLSEPIKNPAVQSWVEGKGWI
jgi:hypothetical protein